MTLTHGISYLAWTAVLDTNVSVHRLQVVPEEHVLLRLIFGFSSAPTIKCHSRSFPENKIVEVLVVVHGILVAEMLLGVAVVVS